METTSLTSQKEKRDSGKTSEKKALDELDKDWEKKERERDRKVEKGLERLSKERDRDKDRLDKEGRPVLDLKDLYRSQRGRLRELFVEIEKEFQILWEENQELRRRLEDSSSGRPISALTENLRDYPPRKGREIKKLGSRFKKEPEWEMLTQFVGHRDGIWEITMSKSDKASFATASADRTARVWSLNGSNPVYIYLGHKGSVNSVRFHPVNRMVCTASGDNSIHIWKIPKPEEKEKKEKEKEKEKEQQKSKAWAPVLDREGTSTSLISQPITSPDNQRFSSSPPVDSNLGTLPPQQELREPYNEQTNTLGVVTITRPILDVKHKSPVVAADWLGNDRFVSASWDNTVKVWSLETGGNVSKPLVDSAIGHDPIYYVTNVSTHSKEPLFLTSSTDSRFRLWDIRTGQPSVSTIPAHTAYVEFHSFESVLSACFVPLDDNLIISGSDDNLVKVWDRRNIRVPRNSIRCSDGINRFGVSPVSSNLALPMDDLRTKVCDINGKQLGRLKSEEKYGHKMMITSAAWSSDDSVIFTASFDRSVIAWALPKNVRETPAVVVP